MTMEIEIRRATAGDAEAVYEIVARALRETNARDYPASVIDRLVLTLPERVASKLEACHTYIAVADGLVVGTASLNGQTVNSVFVHPDFQGRGIGTKLMDAVENAAEVQSERTLSVQSSITAQPFYAKRGFKVVREAFYGEERTIVMSKDIPSLSG
jgi:N-acetylglutamate synthase-like GNAT family acetyltransferase